MSVASSFPCIKISPSPSCSYSSSSSSCNTYFMFSSSSSSTKPCYVKTSIIRSSQTEGPIRRPAAPSPPTLKPPTPPSKSPSPPQPQPTAPAASGVTTKEGMSVVTLEFQRQKAKEIQDYFKQKKLEEANQGPFFGFVGKNEISNGRWAMFGFAVGMLTEYATGSDFVDQVGEGTYSNVYKARDRDTGKIVALKKVRFDTSEPESVKFMAREILFLRKLDHPNVLKLEGLATSRMQYSIYLVFDFMHSDLSKLISSSEGLTEPQVKCYMHQLLSGLQHCHDRGILHRDIKGSNLLIDKHGVLKIGDFGLANYYVPKPKHPLTNRVVTLWYRAPELLLGATDYGIGIDLWSAGCVFAEMFKGRPLMPGRTEVEQLHRIFKLCGTPSEEYWKKLKLSTTFRPPRSYKPSLQEAFKDLPSSSLGLLGTLLALDPAYRGSAAHGLKNEFFFTNPLACELSGLPVIYNEEEELKLANEQRKFRSSKSRQRSRKQREQRKQDAESVTQEVKKTEESIIENIEEQPGSASSSTSSGLNQTSRKESPIFSPIKSSNKKMSPNTAKNIPPLPQYKACVANYNDDNDIYRSNLINRSLSTREFRMPVRREKKLELYAVDD